MLSDYSTNSLEGSIDMPLGRLAKHLEANIGCECYYSVLIVSVKEQKGLSIRCQDVLALEHNVISRVGYM